MKHFFRWCLSVLVLVPLFAQADPFKVQAEARGTMWGESLWLSHFDENIQQKPEPLPFSFVAEVTLDPDSPSFLPDDDDSDGVQVWQFGKLSSMALTLGDHSYQLTDTSSFVMYMTGDWFILDFHFDGPYYNYPISLGLHDPGGRFSGEILSPREVGTDNGIGATVTFLSFPRNPDAPGFWDAYGVVTSFASIRVSAVPEPAPAAMLLAGLLLLARTGSRAAKSQLAAAAAG